MKNTEYLEMMDNALFWQFRYIDAMDDLSTGVNIPGASFPLLNCTEIFLLDVSNIILALSVHPRKVLRRFPWLRRMFRLYPKIRKVFYAMSSPKVAGDLLSMGMSVPEIMGVVSRLQFSDSCGRPGKNYEELLKLQSLFFQNLGLHISIRGWGIPQREDEFLQVEAEIRAYGHGTAGRKNPKDPDGGKGYP